jgi:hypothetical protein
MGILVVVLCMSLTHLHKLVRLGSLCTDSIVVGLIGFFLLHYIQLKRLGIFQ